MDLRSLEVKPNFTITWIITLFNLACYFRPCSKLSTQFCCICSACFVFMVLQMLRHWSLKVKVLPTTLFRKSLFLQLLTFRDVSAPGPSFWIQDLKSYHQTPLCQICILNLDILQEFQAFATVCPSVVWCCGLTICLLYVSPLFWKFSYKKQLVLKFNMVETVHSLFLLLFIYIYIYIHEYLIFYLA